MSKIEEALQKARAMQSAGQSAGNQEPPRPEAPTPEPPRLSESREIARLDETDPLSPAELAMRRIIYPGMRNTQVLNVFRHLRTTLLQQVEGKSTTLLVSATAARGGGSFVSRNLAAAIALDVNKSAVIVDSNLYRPATGDLLDIDQSPGLTDYLLEPTVGVHEVVHTSGVPRMRLVPPGTRRNEPDEFFALDRMRRLLAEVAHRHPDAVVIVDAPATDEHSADVRLLAELADLALVVVPYARSTPEQVEHAVAVVGQDRLLGTVFNDEPSSAAFS